MRCVGLGEAAEGKEETAVSWEEELEKFGGVEKLEELKTQRTLSPSQVSWQLKLGVQ